MPTLYGLLLHSEAVRTRQFASRFTLPFTRSIGDCDSVALPRRVIMIRKSQRANRSLRQRIRQTRSVVRRSLTLEPLETRLLLAGDVTAYVYYDTLMIIGDAADNIISLTSGDVPGEIEVQGKQTTINGSSKKLSFDSFDHVSVQLGDGDDAVKLRGASIPLSLTVNGGTGDDDIELVSTAVGQSITIQGDLNQDYVGEAGNDHIRVNQVEFTGTPSGYASLMIAGDNHARSTITGGGNDLIIVNGITIESEPDEGRLFTNIRFDISGDINNRTSWIGGNDEIQITNISLHSETYATVRVVGDSTAAINGDDFMVTGGDDVISVTNVRVSAGGTTYGDAMIEILGDSNYSRSDSAGDTRLTVVGGNDVIDITNTTIAAATGDERHWVDSTLSILGERNYAYADRFYIGSAVINQVGGDDIISITNTSVTTRDGGSHEKPWIDIHGEFGRTYYDSAINIVGGNDSLDIVNSTVSGGFYYNPNVHAGQLRVRMDDEHADYLSGGSDSVLIKELTTTSSLGPDTRVDIETGGGDDTLVVLQSVLDFLYARLGAGDDHVVFGDNVLNTDFTQLDGGDGWDTIIAYGNIGLFNFQDFEEEDVS